MSSRSALLLYLFSQIVGAICLRICPSVHHRGRIVQGASLRNMDSSSSAPSATTLSVTASAAAVLLAATPFASLSAETTPVDYSQLLQDIQSKKVSRVTFAPDELSIVAKTADGTFESTNVMPSVQKELVQLLLSNEVPFTRSNPPGIDNPVFATVVQFLNGLVNLAVPLLLLFFFIGPRIIGSGGAPGGRGDNSADPSNPWKMMNSISNLVMEPRTGVDFTQVAGCDEAKLELIEGKPELTSFFMMN